MNKRTIAIGLAGAMVLGTATPGFAAPVMTNTAILKAAQPNAVINVRWRGRHGRWHGQGWAEAGVGLAAGALLGYAIGRSRAYPYYYYVRPSYYYAPPPVYPEPAPVYVAPPPVYAGTPLDPNGPARQCWVSADSARGFGYWQPC